MPRPRDEVTRLEFTRDEEHPEKQRCNHCKNSMSSQVSAMKRHLRHCRVYQTYAAEAMRRQKPARPATTTARPPRRSPSIEPQPRSSPGGQPQVIQPLQATPRPAPSGLEETINFAFAKAVILGGVSFGALDSDLFKAAFRHLRVNYTPPDQQLIRSTYLPKLYDEYYEKVRAEIDFSDDITVILEISEDARKRQILTISFQLTDTNRAYYYWHTQNLGRDFQIAENTVALVRFILEGLVKGRTNLWKIRAFCVDSSDTLRLAQALVDTEDFNHCWAVLCDSQGLQALVKDIVTGLEPWRTTFNSASALVSAFRSSRLQYSRLLDCQRSLNDGKSRPFLQSTVAPWGSQYRCCKAVKDNREALIKYAQHEAINEGPEITVTRAIVNIVNDHIFWSRLNLLVSILEPVQNAIVASESETSYLGFVLNRWNSIHLAWTRLQSEPSHQEVDFESLFRLYQKDQAEGIGTIHRVAWSLDFHSLPTPLNAFTFSEIEKWIRRHTPSEQVDYVINEFNAYRSLQGCYSKANLKGLLKPKDLWCKRMVAGSLLSHLALRVFNTVCNSAPSERAFSSMGYLLDTRRDPNNAEASDQLLFIHMNRRVIEGLDRKTMELMDEEDQEDFEERLFATLSECKNSPLG